MNVVDLFCGLKGWSAPFLDRGHHVWTTDIDPEFDPDLATDVRVLADIAASGSKPFDTIDVLLASPPCESFSVASIGHHWTGGRRAYVPKTNEARTGIELVKATLRLISIWQPRIAVIENPRGVLRNLGLLHDPVTVWYCHYGETRAKPTDLWGYPFPDSWHARPKCHNRRPGHPTECCCKDHEAAPRGAKTGTQGINTYALRSEIPYELATSICLGAEGNSAWVA